MHSERSVPRDTRDWIFAQLGTLSHEDLKDAANEAIESIEDRT